MRLEDRCLIAIFTLFSTRHATTWSRGNQSFFRFRRYFWKYSGPWILIHFVLEMCRADYCGPWQSGIVLLNWAASRSHTVSSLLSTLWPSWGSYSDIETHCQRFVVPQTGENWMNRLSNNWVYGPLFFSVASIAVYKTSRNLGVKQFKLNRSSRGPQTINVSD